MPTLLLSTDDRYSVKYAEKLKVYKNNYIGAAYGHHNTFREFCEDCGIYGASLFSDWSIEEVNQSVVAMFLNTVANNVLYIYGYKPPSYKDIPCNVFVDLNTMFLITPKNKWMAACGTLFVKIASDCEHMTIISNNDYVMNRIIMDIRDNVCNIKPEDFEIEYDKVLLNITIDKLGNVIGATEEYRKFEMDELNRQLWGERSIRKEYKEALKERIER